MKKKSRTSKKNEANDLEVVTGSSDAAPMGVGNSSKWREQDKKKKNKGKQEFGGNVELDIGGGLNKMGCSKVDGDLLKEKYHREDRKIGFGEGTPDCIDVETMTMENVFKSGKEHEKSKNKKKREVGDDVELDGISGKAVNGKGYVEVDSAPEEKKDQKKKKKKRKSRKLESGDDKGASNDMTQTEVKENRSLQTNGGTYLGNDIEWVPEKKDQKKRHKEKRKNDGSDTVSSSMGILEGENVGKDEIVNGHKSSDKEAITEMKNGEEGAKGKKIKKRRRDNEDSDVEGKKKANRGKEVGKTSKGHDGDVMRKVEKKKRKREKVKDKDDLGAGLQENTTGELGNESTILEDKDFVDSEGNAHTTKKQDGEAEEGNIGKKKKAKSVENGSGNPKPKGNSKKVKFASYVEVFPSDNPSTRKDKKQEEGLVQGKRFSRKEDEIIKEAVFNYIKAHDLGKDGLNMVLQCRAHPEIKNCWKEIGLALPYRPNTAIYYRAHILFERAEKRAWTEEEYELIRSFQKEHGNNWKKLADDLGKHRFHLKDTWRRIKPPNLKKGQWSQEEYQTLFDLVNVDLHMKAFEEKKSKHGMLRDNICWEAISDKLTTRNNSTCCRKWYQQLTSSMVADGIWADADDYRLLDALYNLDACCIEDVDWDNLLDHRSGDVCRKRWDQMVLHIGHHGNKSFAEQIEILAKRYSPDLLEAREAWDSKPVVP